MFTVINGVLLKPLPYPAPDRLVKVEGQTKAIIDYRWGDRWAFSYPNRSEERRVGRECRCGLLRWGGDRFGLLLLFHQPVWRRIRQRRDDGNVHGDQRSAAQAAALSGARQAGESGGADQGDHRLPLG